MTTKIDASEQVKFLITCISHTTNGRVGSSKTPQIQDRTTTNQNIQPDFGAVAEELGIVTKAAA